MAHSGRARLSLTFVVTLMSAFLAACGDEGSDTASSSQSEEVLPSRASPPATVPPPSDVPAPPPSLKLVIETSIVDLSIVRNGEVTPGLRVRYEPLAAPRLAELRSRENLDAVVSGAADEFERMLRLKDWVAAQWPQGTPNPYPPWDAITVLDWIRRGITGGFCAQYAQVLSQSLAALGYHSRYLEIGSNDNPYAHFVLEVWSNQFNKWIVLDPDYNLHFERAGVPLSALEVHEALTRGNVSDVATVLGSFRGRSDPSRWPLRTAELYYYLRVHLKANHLTMPNENPFDRYNDMIEWDSEIAVPWAVSTVPSPYRKEALTNQETSDRSLMAGKLNQVLVTVESVDSDSVQLRFETNDDEFVRYQIRERALPNGTGEWRDHESSTFVWHPRPIATALEVRALNVRSVGGPSSRVAATLDIKMSWVEAAP